MDLATRIVLWIVVAFVLATPMIEIAFLAVASAKRVQDAGIKMPLSMRCCIWALRIGGTPADILYNVGMGSIRFREFPREWAYSSRVERHYNTSTGKQFSRAAYWFTLLNTIWPNHIKDKR